MKVIDDVGRRCCDRKKKGSQKRLLYGDGVKKFAGENQWRPHETILDPLFGTDQSDQSEGFLRE
jgi:hypothetical protein